MSRWHGALCRICAMLSVSGSAACTQRGGDSTPRQEHLGSDVAARVADDAISLESVRRIASAQNLDLYQARARAIADALLARGAREMLGELGFAERGVLARALLERLMRDAEQAGLPSDPEVAFISAERWQEFERPESVRVSHAVARVKDAKDAVRAHALAVRIREAVRGLVDPEAFISAANAVPRDGIEVRAERLPAMTADGRAYYPEGVPEGAASASFDLDFARAANAVPAGTTSEIVRTQFGYHVILCETRLPAKNVPIAERRQIFREEVLKRRAELAKTVLLERLQSTTPITIERSVDELTAKVRVSP
jgi:peptidyl-prolyl cis-trans isomerase C